MTDDVYEYRSVHFNGDRVSGMYSLVPPDVTGNTIFAAGFSEEAYNTVREGWEKRRVLGLLGPPLVQSLVYSEAENGGSYRVRCLHLESGRVTRAVPHVYID